AIDDPDGAVRSNAMKALSAVAVFAQRIPALGIKISPTWFVEMLNSVVLSDRTEATKALLLLTDSANPGALDLIRERALGGVVEVARWKSLRCALPGFLLAGRMAGMKDAEVHDAWEKGDRAAVLDKLSAGSRKGR